MAMYMYMFVLLLVSGLPVHNIHRDATPGLRQAGEHLAPRELHRAAVAPQVIIT